MTNTSLNKCHALVVTAHCDDAELWAGGTLAQWADEGLRCVTGIAFHDKIRREETRSSSVILGYEARFLEQEQMLSSWILAFLHELRPQVLLTHPENDPHPDHQSVHRQTIQALTKFPHRRVGPLRWYAFDSYYQTRSHATWPMIVDIGSTLHRKLEALAQHRSQEKSGLVHMATHYAAMTGMRARMEHAEAFYPFDLLGRWPVLRELP
uniref:N-acetylglucosaminyl deacetylase, LmbE family n=1 Tax=Candidatus Kentrum sp. LFY TaxID=2126342 RepID=A0A450U7S2_9GAMM|nr:MAG: N-acetylglucosaminyl deacetylase, LmbE family [Candidatus Kentron sp. LFY]